MKFALVKTGDSQIFDISPVAFPVADPLRWVSCADTVSRETHEFFADDFRLVAPVAPSARALALANIVALEKSVTQRRLREAALSDAGKAWLANVDALIAIERAKL